MGPAGAPTDQGLDVLQSSVRSSCTGRKGLPADGRTLLANSSLLAVEAGAKQAAHVCAKEIG